LVQFCKGSVSHGCGDLQKACCRQGTLPFIDAFLINACLAKKNEMAMVVASIFQMLMAFVAYDTSIPKQLSGRAIFS
jgi:hypothetical protein